MHSQQSHPSAKYSLWFMESLAHELEKQMQLKTEAKTEEKSSESMKSLGTRYYGTVEQHVELFNASINNIQKEIGSTSSADNRRAELKAIGEKYINILRLLPIFYGASKYFNKSSAYQPVISGVGKGDSFSAYFGIFDILIKYECLPAELIPLHIRYASFQLLERINKYTTPPLYPQPLFILPHFAKLYNQVSYCTNFIPKGLNNNENQSERRTLLTMMNTAQEIRKKHMTSYAVSAYKELDKMIEASLFIIKGIQHQHENIFDREPILKSIKSTISQFDSIHEFSDLAPLCDKPIRGKKALLQYHIESTPPSSNLATQNSEASCDILDLLVEPDSNYEYKVLEKEVNRIIDILHSYGVLNWNAVFICNRLTTKLKESLHKKRVLHKAQQDAKANATSVSKSSSSSVPMSRSITLSVSAKPLERSALMIPASRSGERKEKKEIVSDNAYSNTSAILEKLQPPSTTMLADKKLNTAWLIPKGIHLADLQENGKLLTDSEILLAKELLKDQPDGYYSKTGALLDGAIPYSIIKQNSHFYAVYKGYKHDSLIGSGAFSTNKHGQDIDSGEYVALKRIYTDENALQMCANESFLLIILKRLPAYKDSEEPIDETKEYFVKKSYPDSPSKFKYVIVMRNEGSEDLGHWILRNSEVNTGVYLQMLVKMIDAICTVLNKNILHRDIAFRNFVVNAFEEVTLIDLGLGKYSENKSYDDHSNIGGTGFMAPEIKTESTEEDDEEEETVNYNTKTEVYAFGVCMENMFQHTDPSITALKDRALNKDPEKRPTFEEIRETLVSEIIPRYQRG